MPPAARTPSRLAATARFRLVSANTNMVQFGTQAVSSKSAAKTVVVTNTGDGDLIISNISRVRRFLLLREHLDDGGAGDKRPAQRHVHAIDYGRPQWIADHRGQRGRKLPGRSRWLEQAFCRDPCKQPTLPLPSRPAPSILPRRIFPTTATITINGTDTTFAAGATVANFGPGTTVSRWNIDRCCRRIRTGERDEPDHRHRAGDVRSHGRARPAVCCRHDRQPSIGRDLCDSAARRAGGQCRHFAEGRRWGARRTWTAAARVPRLRPRPAPPTAKRLTSTPNPLLIYQWSLLSAPDGSTTAIADGTAVRPSFNGGHAGHLPDPTRGHRQQRQYVGELGPGVHRDDCAHRQCGREPVRDQPESTCSWTAAAPAIPTATASPIRGAFVSQPAGSAATSVESRTCRSANIHRGPGRRLRSCNSRSTTATATRQPTPFSSARCRRHRLRMRDRTRKYRWARQCSSMAARRSILMVIASRVSGL